MKVKSVVKVMNFHALVRVDKARREAEKLAVMEEKLRSMIDTITNNINLMLDKYILTIDPHKPILNIYIGSDMGFCGGYNFVVNQNAKKDEESVKVLIGKKLWNSIPNVELAMTKDEYMKNAKPLDDLLTDGILNSKYSQINIFFNEYENSSTIHWNSKRVYPFEFNNEESQNYQEDIVCETDINNLIRKMIVTYIDFEVMITVINSLASENVMREASTSESLKKIDEIEEEKYLLDRKQKSRKQFQKIIEDYSKIAFTQKN